MNKAPLIIAGVAVLAVAAYMFVNKQQVEGEVAAPEMAVPAPAPEMVPAPEMAPAPAPAPEAAPVAPEAAPAPAPAPEAAPAPAPAQ